MLNYKVRRVIGTQNITSEYISVSYTKILSMYIEVTESEDITLSKDSLCPPFFCIYHHFSGSDHVAFVL